MMKKLLLLGIVVLLLTGCADTVSFEAASEITPVGFWDGLCHGLILPFSWFVSLFDNDVAIYAIYNNGSWYDFGFFVGCGGWSTWSAGRCK